jgi:hypothetical protein
MTAGTSAAVRLKRPAFEPQVRRVNPAPQPAFRRRSDRPTFRSTAFGPGQARCADRMVATARRLGKAVFTSLAEVPAS